MQKFLRELNEDSTECVTLGPSIGNRRIERWWATLRAQCSLFWMDHFGQLREDGHFVDTFIDKSLIQFCFQNTIQEELNEVLTAWNNHRIRPAHNPRASSGRPSVMYAAPSLNGAQNYLQAVDQIKVDICREDCCVKDYPCDEDVYNLCVELMSEHNFAMPDDVFEITDLY
uniref:Integrase core domain-containing protein n=1 Tax=Lepisosteus oculatus TaxID=7918 RepID=W5LW98_LEPOC